MRILYTDRAKADVETAFAWYEKQRKGLGLEFLNCVEARFESLLAYPQSCENIYADFKRATIRRFPFSIFYTVESDKIIVHAVFDNRQDPEKHPR